MGGRFGYPICLDLTGRTVVVIGRTAVALGKVEDLLAGGAHGVLIVAEAPAQRLDALESDPRVRVRRRHWRPRDLDGAVLCVASGRTQAERDAIAREARARGVLVNLVDDVPNCDFASPAIVRRGELAIAISTGGRSPALARRLREELQERFGKEWEEIVRVLGQVRDETRDRLPEFTERARRWQLALDLDEAVDLVRAGRVAEWRELLVSRLLHPADSESVA